MTIRYAAYAASPTGGFDLFWVDKTPGTKSIRRDNFRHVQSQDIADKITIDINCRQPLIVRE